MPGETRLLARSWERQESDCCERRQRQSASAKEQLSQASAKEGAADAETQSPAITCRERPDCGWERRETETEIETGAVGPLRDMGQCPQSTVGRPLHSHWGGGPHDRCSRVGVPPDSPPKPGSFGFCFS